MFRLLWEEGYSSPIFFVFLIETVLWGGGSRGVKQRMRLLFSGIVFQSFVFHIELGFTSLVLGGFLILSQNREQFL